MQEQQQKLNWQRSDKWPRKDKPAQVNYSTSDAKISIGQLLPGLAELREKLSSEPEDLNSQFEDITTRSLLKQTLSEFQLDLIKKNPEAFSNSLNGYFLTKSSEK